MAKNSGKSTRSYVYVTPSEAMRAELRDTTSGVGQLGSDPLGGSVLGVPTQGGDYAASARGIRSELKSGEVSGQTGRGTADAADVLAATAAVTAAALPEAAAEVAAAAEAVSGIGWGPGGRPVNDGTFAGRGPGGNVSPGNSDWGTGGNPGGGVGGDRTNWGDDGPGYGGEGNPDRGPAQDGENPGNRPDNAGNPGIGNGDGDGDGIPDRPDDAGNPGNGNGDGTGDGDGISDKPAPAPTPPDVPLLDAEDSGTYHSEYTFRVGDITLSYDGDILADNPNNIDMTQSMETKSGVVLHPIDSEFGFYVSDFIGATDKVYDYDYGEGWVGELPDGNGIMVSDARTDTFSVPARMGTWLEGIGGNFVKASTEHYSVMQAILSDQAFPGDTSGLYQLDDDLRVVDWVLDEDGQPVFNEALGTYEKDVMHNFYIKELVQALENASTAPMDTDTVDFASAVFDDFMPGYQDFGDYTVSPDGLTLNQESQSWDSVLGDFTITADTRLSFDFSAGVVGEIHGIMFTNGENQEESTFIKIAGSQDYGFEDYAGYSATLGVQSYDIPIGELFTGSFDRMVFVTDDDAHVGADSTWSNVTFSTPLSDELDFDRDGTMDVYSSYMADVEIDGVTRNVAVVDLGADGSVDYYDLGLNGFGTYGIQDILAPNESTVLADIAVGDDYSVTVKDDGKLLYRWGNAVKRPNDIRIDAKLALPDEFKADADSDGFADTLYRVTAAELVVNHTVTNNPNDQIRPEDFENEAAIGRLPDFVAVLDPFNEGNVLWVSTAAYYAGDGTFLDAYITDVDTGIVVEDLNGVPIGYYNEGGTVLRDFSLAEAVEGSTLDQIGALSSDLEGGYTEAWYTTMDREPFMAVYDEATGEYEIGPRWRLQPDKYGQDLPSVIIPIDPADAPPVANGEEKYEVGADTTTVLNLLDWDGTSPLSLSAGWMSNSGDTSVNGLNMTDDFDVAFYVKGDIKPVSLYDAQLLMQYEEIAIADAGTTLYGTIGENTLVGRGGNTFDLSGLSYGGADAQADLFVLGYGATTAAGLGENFVFDFGIEEGDALGLIGFGLDPDNYNVHITQELVGDEATGYDLELALDGDMFATLYGVEEYLGADSFYFA